MSTTSSALFGGGTFIEDVLVGKENGTTKVGLVSSVAGYHGTWIHPSPGTPISLNVTCVGGGGGQGGAYSSSGTGVSGNNGTKTIFGAITANFGFGGGSVGASGNPQTGYGSNTNADKTSTWNSISNNGEALLQPLGLYNAGAGGDSSQQGTKAGAGGTAFVALTGSLTVTGNVDYIIGAGGTGGDKSGGHASPGRFANGAFGMDGVIILKYNK